MCHLAQARYDPVSYFALIGDQSKAITRATNYMWYYGVLYCWKPDNAFGEPNNTNIMYEGSNNVITR